MKTEMKTVYVSFRQWIGSMRCCGGEFTVSFDKPVNTSDSIYAPICEAQIAVPKVSKEDIELLLNGAEIEALHGAKEKLQADTHRKLQAYDERIGQLTAIENKEQ